MAKQEGKSEVDGESNQTLPTVYLRKFLKIS